MVMFMTISPTEDMNGVCTASVLLGWLGAGMGEGRRDGSKLKYPLRLSKSLITSSSQ